MEHGASGERERVSSLVLRRPEVNLTVYLHLVLRIGKSGAIPLLSVCTFVAWRGTAFTGNCSNSLVPLVARMGC